VAAFGATLCGCPYEIHDGVYFIVAFWESVGGRVFGRVTDTPLQNHYAESLSFSSFQILGVFVECLL
jgi:hypothetical protein